jgi:metal-responsive CopG/Arc/MetJ family transcriptional regulator
MKTAISLPDELYRNAMSAAKKMSLTRSALFARAVDEFLRNHRPSDTTERLDAIYKHEPGKIDLVIAQRQTNTKEEGSSL